MQSAKRQLVELHWQWPEGRRPTHRIAVDVKEIGKWSGGPLGIGRSPSLPNGFADPLELRAAVVFNEPGWTASSVSLVAPAEELAGARAGDRLALAIIAGSYELCICASKVPPEIQPAALGPWLAAWNCKTVAETLWERQQQARPPQP